MIGIFFATLNSISGGPSRNLRKKLFFDAARLMFQNANNSIARGYEIA